MSFDQVLKTGCRISFGFQNTTKNIPGLRICDPFSMKHILKTFGGVICWWELANFLSDQKPSGAPGGFAEEELEHLKHLAAQMDEAFPEVTWQ